jgi:DNA-binding NtrC family response regulator
MTKILFVDDEKDFRDGMKEYLRASEIEVDVADNGRTAWHRITENVYDVVVTDILMPEMDGFDLIEKIKKEHPEIQIIAMTGGGKVTSDNYLYLSKAYGAFANLKKPFPAAILLEAIRLSLLSSFLRR